MLMYGSFMASFRVVFCPYVVTFWLFEIFLQLGKRTISTNETHIMWDITTINLYANLNTVLFNWDCFPFVRFILFYFLHTIKALFSPLLSIKPVPLSNMLPLWKSDFVISPPPLPYSIKPPTHQWIDFRQADVNDISAKQCFLEFQSLCIEMWSLISLS